MNIFQSIMMWVGILSCVYWLYRLGRVFYQLLGNLFEQGFRNRFPYDYLSTISWITDIFYQHGFDKNSMDYDIRNSDKPGIILRKQDNKVEIYLIAPLEGEQRIKVILKRPATNIVLPVEKIRINEDFLHSLCVMEENLDCKDNKNLRSGSTCRDTPLAE